MVKQGNKVEWVENGVAHSAQWVSELGHEAPSKIMVADDTLSANQAYAWAKENVRILWRGDYQNARNLLQALVRRVNRPPRTGTKPIPKDPVSIFLNFRQEQAEKARILHSLIIPLDANFQIPLKRAQDVSLACQEVLGNGTEAGLISLRELLAYVSAHEWRKKKVWVEELGQFITPHFGVFSPIRGEYLKLIMQSTLVVKNEVAFDIGTGTGILSALLVKRGFKKVIATDIDDRALACAKENIKDLKLNQVEILKQAYYPQAKANLIVCNPPWLPSIAHSSVEGAIFDENSNFLKTALMQAKAHLETEGEFWLVMSNFAELVELRSRAEFLQWIEDGELEVIDELQTKPVHPKTRNTQDPLYAFRAREVTSLWRLRKK